MKINQERLEALAAEWLPVTEIAEYHRMQKPHYRMGDWPNWHLVEFLAHEMGHWLGLGESLSEPPGGKKDISSELAKRSDQFCDFNELRATVVTMRVGAEVNAPTRFIQKAEQSVYGNIGSWFTFDDDEPPELAGKKEEAALRRMLGSRRTKRMAKKVIEELQRQGVLQ